MLTPTFSASGIDLYLGDSAIVLQELTVDVDLLATDPPYEVAFQSGFGPSAGRFDVMAGDRGEGDVLAIIEASVKMLREGRHAYVCGPINHLANIETLTAHVPLVWDKGNIGMGDLSLPRGPSHEPINFAVRVKSKANRARGNGQLSARLRQGSVLRVDRLNSGAVKRHQTEKPVELMRQLIESSSCFGDTVFDPFMGSGSTIIAAMLEGRHAVGIELDPRYFAVAKGRVEALLPLLDKLRTA